MPGKGHAFDKPTVNATHKSEVRKQAQLFAHLPATNRGHSHRHRTVTACMRKFE
jgi:hypothetical protein